MLLSEIVDQVMLESGLFISGDITNLKVTYEQFFTLVKRALGIYDKYKPISRVSRILTNDNAFTFFGDQYQIPEFISSATPTGYGVVNAFSIMNNASMSDGDTPQIVFRYTKPTLITSLSGEYEIRGNYKRRVTVTYCDPEQTKIDDVDISDLDYSDQYFIDLVTGLFLILIGKFRRSVVLNDSDVTFDSGVMVEEGQQLYAQALQNIQDTARWYLGVGN